ncbi:DndE family protein [Halomonas sp. LR3S48]|uniref:DndE family protein n=1 Tax=Halomonas sp. LR3S48 TaxID=2982694 RepID=UPI00398EA93A
MLPNRFSLTSYAEDRLKKDKSITGIAINIAARELFFRSIERGIKFSSLTTIAWGKMELDKATWLGDCRIITELLLTSMYPKHDSAELATLFAMHIDAQLSENI